jgi:molybdate transport system substrate-binding protein
VNEPSLTIIAVGAVKHALAELARTPGLPSASLQWFTAGGARDRVLGGGAFDLVLTSDPALDALQDAGRIVPPRIALDRTGLGFAVPRGAPALAVATPQALASTLRAAPSIAMADPASGATAGTHFQSVLDQLGLAQDLERRITRHTNGMLAVAEVAAGRAAIGVSQETEILPTDGVALGGMLPEPLQRWTGYGAALAAAADPRAGAWLELLGGARAREMFARTGFRA